MIGNLIATTQKDQIQALAFKGITVYECFSQIRDMLQRKFGDEYVLLFARPEENRGSGEIDWYTPVQGQPQMLDNVVPEKRDPAVARVKAMAEDIRAYADELMRSADSQTITRGNILRLALCYPDQNCLYLVGEQPVFICWGCGPGTPGVEPKELTRLASPKPAPVQRAESANPAASPEAVAPKAAQKAAGATAGLAWLWWFLPLLAACLLLMLLFTSFGHLDALAGKALFQGPELPFLSSPGDKGRELAELENEIGHLRQQLQEHAALCKKNPQPDAVQKNQEHAQLPPAPVQSKQGEELTLPKNAENMEFLKGKWRCYTGLYSQRTGEPVEVLFEFDGNGNGQSIVYEKNDQCIGKASASLQNGKLSIAVDRQVCAKDGNSYNEVKIICQNATGQSTQCNGENKDGSAWIADFRKVQ